MLGLILYLNILFSPFSSSVSTSIRSHAAILNPAGLGIQPGYEFHFNLRKSDNKYIYYFSSSFYNLGFSFIDYLKTEIYSFSIGIPIIESFSIGYGYSFGDLEENKFGFIFSPFKILRFGGIFSIQNYDTSLTLSTSLRPLGDRLTFSADFNFWKITDYTLYQFVYEMVDGIYIYGGTKVERKSDKKFDKRYFAGLEFSFGNLKTFFINRFKEKEKIRYSGGFVLSREIYPTVFPERKKWVKIEFKGSYPEEREIEGFLKFKIKKSFYDLIEELKRIEKEKYVEGIIIVFKNPSFTPSQAEEIYNILKEIKSRGKKIVSIGESFGIINYMIASISDKIIIVPTGDVLIPGLYMENIYLKKMFEKAGIEPEFERIGKYKSAVEPFLREDMSPEDKEQRMEFLKDVENLIIKNIKDGRKLTEERINEIMNKGYFNSEDAVKEGICDAEGFERDIPELIKKWYNKKALIFDSNKILKKKYLMREFKDERPKIAILSMEGSIIVGESSKNPIPIIGGKNMGSETMSKLIEKIEKDKSIKAVVCRVNSPGGSALASEIIWDAIRRLKEKKPVVVSMGQVAGSGGYYISCIANKIYADKTTLTGSIGILGGKFVLKEFFEKFGIKFDRVKTREHADAFSFTRKFDEKEREIFKREIEWGYNQFVKRVSLSRNIPFEKVDSIGQGRIYSGEDAKNIKLVDETGGILDAIEEAKRLARIKGDVRIIQYPEIKWWNPFKTLQGTSLNSPLFEENYLYMMPFLIEF